MLPEKTLRRRSHDEADTPEMTGTVVAVMFEEVARFIRREVAAGTPPKVVAYAAADLALDYAREARSEVAAP